MIGTDAKPLSITGKKMNEHLHQTDDISNQYKTLFQITSVTPSLVEAGHVMCGSSCQGGCNGNCSSCADDGDGSGDDDDDDDDDD